VQTFRASSRIDQTRHMPSTWPGLHSMLDRLDVVGGIIKRLLIFRKQYAFDGAEAFR